MTLISTICWHVEPVMDDLDTYTSMHHDDFSAERWYDLYKRTMHMTLFYAAEFYCIMMIIALKVVMHQGAGMRTRSIINASRLSSCLIIYFISLYSYLPGMFLHPITDLTMASTRSVSFWKKLP